ncbi:MAG: glycosyltransferase family 2 protein [Spirochaetes bacterium]|nr:glycosyltransferase family 2 protein [Spirochaetota bacterium]
MKVDIVMPAFNEEKAIGTVIKDIKKSMKGKKYKYQIVVIDDGSTDNTVTIAKKLGARIIQNEVRMGSGFSRKKAIRLSTSDVVVMIDADGTYPAKDIPKILSYFPKYDQVIGARKKETGTFRIFRSFAKNIIKALASYLAGIRIPDLNTGLRAFKTSIMKKYIYIVPNGFSGVSTMTLIFLLDDYKVKFVPIEYYKRIGKSKFRFFADTLSYLETVIRIIINFKPLKVFLPFGLFLLFAGIIKVFIEVLFWVGYIQQSSILIILTSLIVFSIGFLADLIVTTGKKNE